MNTISSYGIAKRSGYPSVDSSREQELEQRLNERLTSRLSHIRQQIASPDATVSDTDSRGVLDIRA